MNSTPQAVAITNDSKPRMKIFTELPLRNLSACIENPTARPIRVVTTSISGPLAVSASLRYCIRSMRTIPVQMEVMASRWVIRITVRP